MNTINKILSLVNIILFVTLILSIIHADKHSILDAEDSEILCYYWSMLHIEYDGLSNDSVWRVVEALKYDPARIGF